MCVEYIPEENITMLPTEKYSITENTKYVLIMGLVILRKKKSAANVTYLFCLAVLIARHVVTHMM